MGLKRPVRGLTWSVWEIRDLVFVSWTFTVAFAVWCELTFEEVMRNSRELFERRRKKYRV